MTTVLLSISLGFILSPIIENLFAIQSTTDIINVNVIGAAVVTLLIGVAGIPALTGEVNSILPITRRNGCSVSHLCIPPCSSTSSFMWLLIKKPVCSDSLSVWFLSLCLFFPRYNTSPNTSETGREMMKQKPILSCWMIFHSSPTPFPSCDAYFWNRFTSNDD